jgi:hypothetical protein
MSDDARAEFVRRHLANREDHFARALRGARLGMLIGGMAFLLVAVACASVLVPAIRKPLIGDMPISVPVLLAALFAPCAVLFFVVAGKMAPYSERLLREGRPATATLVEVRGGRFSIKSHSGTIARSVLVLDVVVDGGAPYRVSHATYVPPRGVVKLRPAAVLPIRVDPRNPQDIAVLWDELGS